MPGSLGRFGANAPASEALTGDIPAPPARARLLIDVTHTVDGGIRTGIQRVVREIARNCVETGAGLPVTNQRLQDFLVLPPPGASGGDRARPRRHSASSRRLLGNTRDDYPPLMRRFEARGGKTVVAVYDILPLDHPSPFRPLTTAHSRAWRERSSGAPTQIVAISRATAESLYEDMREAHPRPPIGWRPLGAYFAAPKGEPGATAVSIAAGPAYFLSVGTLEPRKAASGRHRAFERLWAAGRDIRYVIVGRPGWEHPRAATAPAPTPQIRPPAVARRRRRRGFAIALRQSARLPVNCAIAGRLRPAVGGSRHARRPGGRQRHAVFREVGGDGPRYFDLLDSKSLAAAIEDVFARPSLAPRIKTISWRGSARELVWLIREEAYQLREGETTSSSRP